MKAGRLIRHEAKGAVRRARRRNAKTPGRVTVGLLSW